MLKKVVLILASLVGSGAFAQEQLSISEIEKLLGSEDFKVRRDTMETLWVEGKISIEILEELGKNDDPEIKARALSLKRKLTLGLAPDTPKEILSLLDDYFSQSVNGKVRLFNKLRTMKEYGLMLRLKAVEKDADALVQLNEIVSEILPSVQISLLRSGSLLEAKKLLLLNQDYRSLIAYANLCAHLGELDQEIGRLRGLDDENSRARYLACLRVKGDAVILKAEAERLGDQDSATVAALVLGDIKPLFERLKEEGDLSISDRRYLEWVLAEWAGDQDKMDRNLSSLQHHVVDSPEVFQARRNLLKMGRPEDVLKSYSKEFIDESRFYFLIGQDRNIEALKLMGLEQANVTDEWLKGAYERTVNRFRDQDREAPSAELFMAARFFESRGMVEGAARSIEMFFDAIRAAKQGGMMDWCSDVYRAAPRGAMIALAREVTEFEADTGSIISSIFQKEDRLEWLLVKLLDKEDNRPPLEVLQLATSFYQEPMVSLEFFEEVEKRFRDEALADQDPEVGLNHLLDFAQIREEGADILLYLRLLKENGDEEIGNLETWYLSHLGKYQEAAKAYEKTGILKTASSPTFLYRAGLVLNRADDFDGKEYLRKARLYSQGAVGLYSKFAEYHADIGELEESRDLFNAALLRMERVNMGELVELDSIIEGSAGGALKARDWPRALAYFELQSWLLKRPLSDASVLRARFRVLFCRGMLAAEEGRREEAIRDLRGAHRLISQDGILADDFFPALREAGLIELHDELFEKSAELVRENIRFFPKDHNMKNTFGWLASRANRSLDEAHGYLEQALEMRPLSAAYLDTMGEIYFAKGDREKAVEWSDRSLNQMVTDPQLRQQNQRFRSGPFPLK